jgi:hypothetical protein
MFHSLPWRGFWPAPPRLSAGQAVLANETTTALDATRGRKPNNHYVFNV